MHEQENRLHIRVADELIKHIQLIHCGQPLGQIIDISYGGVLLQPSEKIASKLRAKENLAVEMKVFQNTVSSELKGVYFKGENIGCAFLHSSMNSLQFLKDILESYRLGTTVRKLDRLDHRQGTCRLNGEQFEGEIDSSQNRGSFYMNVDRKFSVVSFHGNEWKTGWLEDESQFYKNMSFNNTLDFESLTRFYFLFEGIKVVSESFKSTFAEIQENMALKIMQQ